MNKTKLKIIKSDLQQDLTSGVTSDSAFDEILEINKRLKIKREAERQLRNKAILRCHGKTTGR